MTIRPIILNYKGCDDTLECLRSLQEQSGNFTCIPIVVDNASDDGSIERLHAAFPDVQVIANSANLGFCGGNNVAIQAAISGNCDYLFLLNNDTTLKRGCLQALLTTAQEVPNAGIVGPAIYYYDNPDAPWFTGSSLDIATGYVCNGETNLAESGQVVPFDVPFSTGCAMLIPAALLQESGLFDERFFCYWEDTDLSVRIKALGYRCLLCPGAKLYHKVSATAKKQAYSHEYYMQRNRLLFVEKHASRAEHRRFLMHEWVVILRYVKRFLTRTLPVTVEFKVQLRALTDYTLRRFGKRTYSWK